MSVSMFITQALFINFLQKDFITLGNKSICENIINSSMTLSLIKSIIKDFNLPSSLSFNYIINISHHLTEPFQEFLKAVEANPLRIKPSLSLEIEPCLIPYEILEEHQKLVHGDVFFNTFDNPYPLIKSQLYDQSLLINVDFDKQELALIRAHKNIQKSCAGTISLMHSTSSPINSSPFQWREAICVLAGLKEEQGFYHYKDWKFKVCA